MTEPVNNEGAPSAARAPDWVMQGPHGSEAPALPAPERKRRGGLGKFVAVLLLLLAVVLAAVGTSPYWAPFIAALLPWSPPARDEGISPQLAQIDQRLGALAQQQSAVEQRLGRAESDLRGVAAATGALRDLSERLAALEQRPTPQIGADANVVAALHDDLAKLAAVSSTVEQRLAKLEARGNSAGQRTEEALLIALGQLRAQVQSAQPFAAELDAAEALARGRPEMADLLKPLEASAAKGLPGMGALTRRFHQDVAPDLLRRALAPHSDDWGEHIWARLRALVLFRRVGDAGAASSDPTEAAIARSETALAHNDLVDAIGALEGLPATGPVEKAWLADAQTRLAADQAISKATAATAARLAAAVPSSLPDAALAPSAPASDKAPER
ncbi:MAG TPA: mitofilin family membrane protein [Stellaceae bacterium]|nr:mitofilin family membrane protein [Stellaceae bacterium]